MLRADNCFSCFRFFNLRFSSSRCLFFKRSAAHSSFNNLIYAVLRLSSSLHISCALLLLLLLFILFISITFVFENFERAFFALVSRSCETAYRLDHLRRAIRICMPCLRHNDPDTLQALRCCQKKWTLGLLLLRIAHWIFEKCQRKCRFEAQFQHGLWNENQTFYFQRTKKATRHTVVLRYFFVNRK